MVRITLVAVLAACRVDSIDLTGKPCPCPDDWVCNPATDTCARSVTDDAAVNGDGVPIDAGIDITTGLAFHFKFDQTMGRPVPDSVLGRNGWLFSSTQAQWTTGQIDNGLHLNGVAYMSFVMYPSAAGQCDAVVSVTSSFSVSVWVEFDSFKPWNTYTMGDVIAMHGTAGGTQGSWGIGASDGCGTETASFSIQAPNEGVRVNRCGSTVLAPNTWYHLAGVYDASARTLDVYVNGVKDNGGFAGVGIVPPSINKPPDESCPYIGSSHNQSGPLAGTVDEYRFYTRALSADAIAEIYRLSK